MTTPRRDLEAELLDLPPAERARIAERLIESLVSPVDEDAEREWIALAEVRLTELCNGRIATEPADETFAEVRSTLR